MNWPPNRTFFCVAMLWGWSVFATRVLESNEAPLPHATEAEAVQWVHRVRDFHVAWLRLLGLDDIRLTDFHGGRYMQLSQIGGRVIFELVG